MPGAELIGAEERKEINDVLETGILFRYNHEQQRKGHWKAKTFEEELAKFTGARYALMCSSGTTAVALCMAACGIGYGDEVIVPPFTYIATIEGVLLAGALPKFVDIDETLCLNPEALQAAITPRTKAVVLVHMCGAMAQVDKIAQICQRHNLILIEDTAQALGASFKGKMLGTFGKMGAFSFDFFKIITAGEGGAIITDDQQLYLNAEMFSDHGHDHIGDNRGMEGHPVLGTNFRISELHAAVGLAQLRKIDYILTQQRKHKKKLKETLAQFPEITFRYLPDPEGDSATFLSFFLPNEEIARRTVKALAENGVSGVQYWYDNHFHYIRNWEHLRGMKTLFKIPAQVLPCPQDYATVAFPASDAIMQRLTSLLIRVTWTEEELEALCQKITKALSKVLAKQFV
ncbi:MAG: DegT/DnrJ/EryC1/StrS family aminotransferase [Cytophagales bacterium]|nr:DegT/DnrJ/EryC1/StrS family aminotransferase [Bernardetiaceae bacterium]MDW8211757.1 DegT/DnrJ/EryC1/StrS family aminotransferase [Cytophagales bacterium]